MPETPDSDLAEQRYAEIKKSVEKTQNRSLIPRRIYKIVWVHNGKDFMAIVDKTAPAALTLGSGRVSRPPPRYGPSAACCSRR